MKWRYGCFPLSGRGFWKRAGIHYCAWLPQKNLKKYSCFHVPFIFAGYPIVRTKQTEGKPMKKSAIILISVTALAGLLFTGCNRYNTAAGAGEGVSEQNAAQTALSHAGLAEQDVQSLTVSKTTKEGANVYAVTFSTEEKTYVYDIERDNGEIISFSFQAAGEDGVSSPDKDDAPSTQTSTDTTSRTDTPPQTGAASTASANDTSGRTNAASSKASSTSAITAAQAQAIALTHAGVAEEDTQLLRVKEDWDDGIAIYEVEFYAGNREYDYDIARDTGKILQFDYDIEGYAPRLFQRHDPFSGRSQATGSVQGEGRDRPGYPYRAGLGRRQADLRRGDLL